MQERNLSIPEPVYQQLNNNYVLYYRTLSGPSDSKLVQNPLEFVCPICFWTAAVILYQKHRRLIRKLNYLVSKARFIWMTLNCHLAPTASELHEVTLAKLLYFHDPEACGRVYFYNYTSGSSSNIVWPVKNEIAAAFRDKMRVWLSLHVVWLLFAFLNMTVRHRPCGFYTVSVPFALTGVAIITVDLVYMTLFLMDTKYTMTEVDILLYINSNKQHVNAIRKRPSDLTMEKTENASSDTSWVSLLLAYMSCRALVQWFINFWLVKDNYFESLSNYRQIQSQHHNTDRSKKSSQSSHASI
ncbi:uncharacterized protein LOC131851047 [Achroia grisella]|uniref:uncharacterized protein LOC131851047 n=1 Tax=Achroia grisella TaxID=688607 RepID=UPI0027D278EE|nr:uncharacterized protein LOC131851047 [Achroia grisella]